MNFLIDECLHTSLVEVAVERGHEATHVNYRGLSGVQDWNLMAPIREGDFTFVTNNAKDFRRLYARNCSEGWHFLRSGDGEVSVDEVADGAKCGLSLDASCAGDGSISGVDLSAPV